VHGATVHTLFVPITYVYVILSYVNLRWPHWGQRTVNDLIISSSSWREAFSRSLPPLRSFARAVGPPLAAGPRSLLHLCRGRSGGSRWSMVAHRRVSTPVKATHHPWSWCRFVWSGLLVHRVIIWRK